MFDDSKGGTVGLLVKDGEKPKKGKTTKSVRLDEDLHKSLKIQATEEGTNIEKYINSLLRNFLKLKPKKSKR